MKCLEIQLYFHQIVKIEKKKTRNADHRIDNFIVAFGDDDDDDDEWCIAKW